MAFHFLRNLLHFHLSGFGARNENDVVIRFEGARLLSKRSSYNSPRAVTLHRAANLLAAGYAHSCLMKPVFHYIGNKTGRGLAFSAVIHPAKILIFL